MLKETFCHVPGINSLREKQLWEQGVHSWEECLLLEDLHSKAHAVERLRLSSVALQRQDVRFFAELLPSREHWRIFPAFRDVTAYLDIETTGLGRPGDHITTIALYDGTNIRTYVHGRNLEDFIPDIHRYKVLVTYNGKNFDIPFIERQFGVRLPHAHLDLMYLLRSVGIKGGLKGCETQLGIGRGNLDGIDGYGAVLLWREYLATGSSSVLETLLAYNVTDAVNLEALAVLAYNRKLATIPGAPAAPLSMPTPPISRFRADADVTKRVTGLRRL